MCGFHASLFRHFLWDQMPSQGRGRVKTGIAHNPGRVAPGTRKRIAASGRAVCGRGRWLAGAGGYHREEERA